MKKCERCMYCEGDINFEKMDVVYTCTKNKMDLTTLDSIKEIEVDCDQFESKYIEYPLEISGIEFPDEKGIRDSYRGKTGHLVAVRPCAEQYENQTFVGFYLGDADVGIHVSQDRNTKKLSIIRHYNPAMFVPELGKVIYGMGSFWKFIKTEEELKQITNEDINNVWYVKALKQLSDNASPEENLDKGGDSGET